MRKTHHEPEGEGDLSVLVYSKTVDYSASPEPIPGPERLTRHFRVRDLVAADAMVARLRSDPDYDPSSERIVCSRIPEAEDS